MTRSVGPWDVQRRDALCVQRQPTTRMSLERFPIYKQFHVREINSIVHKSHSNRFRFVDRTINCSDSSALLTTTTTIVIFPFHYTHHNTWCWSVYLLIATDKVLIDRDVIIGLVAITLITTDRLGFTPFDFELFPIRFAAIVFHWKCSNKSHPLLL